MLVRYPDPVKIRRLGAARLTRFLKQHRTNRADASAGSLVAAVTEQRSQVTGSSTAAELVAQLACELHRLLEAREANSQEIEAAFFALPEAPILISLPGVGPRLGAKIAVEIGDIGRFASAAKLASYAGLGPSARQSGTSLSTAVPSRRGNHRGKNACSSRRSRAFATRPPAPTTSASGRKARDTTRRSCAWRDDEWTCCTRCSFGWRPTVGHQLRSGMRAARPLDKQHRDAPLYVGAPGRSATCSPVPGRPRRRSGSRAGSPRHP